MEETVKERIMKFIEISDISVNKFEKASGLAVGYLRQLRKEPSPTKIKSIISAFPNLNPTWLLTGKGEMLIMDGKTSSAVALDHSTAVSGSDVAINPDISQITNRFLSLLEEKDRQIDRLINIIERNNKP